MLKKQFTLNLTQEQFNNVVDALNHVAIEDDEHLREYPGDFENPEDKEERVNQIRDLDDAVDQLVKQG